MSSHHVAGPHLDQYELSQYAAERYAVLTAVKEARSTRRRFRWLSRAVAPRLVAVPIETVQDVR